MAIVLSILPMSLNVQATTYIKNPSSASGSDYTSSANLAALLNGVFSGDIDIYSNSSCTNEVSMPIGTNMSNSTQYYVKSKTTGNNVSGWQCYIYANAVYNKLFNEWVGHGNSMSHSEVVLSGGANSISYSYLSNAGVRCGAYMRTTTKSSGAFSGSGGHSLIILSYNSSSISYIEGNGDGKGAVRIATKTWSEFNSGHLSGRSRYVAHIVQPTKTYYDSLYSNSSVSYSYNFSFNANGGTLGSTGAFSTSYGSDFRILNTTCTRSGYTWAGWNVKRNNDNKWYVAGRGWCTESEINNNGYSKKTYSNGQTCTLDDSWTSGLSGDGSYTFYAVWIKERQTTLKLFVSPQGQGVDHLTALNTSMSSGYTQDRIYVWYFIYDSYTGQLLEEYADKTYNLNLSISDPYGNEVKSCEYNNCANWISIVPQKSGTYTAKAVITGDYEGTLEFDYYVSYDTSVVASQDSVTLNMNSSNTAAIDFTPIDSFPGNWTMKAYFDSSVVNVTSWEKNNGSGHMEIQGLKQGTTDMRIDLVELYSGNESVVATVSVPITVNASTYIISYNANGGTNAPASQIKYHGTNLTLTEEVPTGPYYTVTFDGNGGTVSQSSKNFHKNLSGWNTKSDGNVN